MKLRFKVAMNWCHTLQVKYFLFWYDVGTGHKIWDFMRSTRYNWKLNLIWTFWSTYPAYSNTFFSEEDFKTYLVELKIAYEKYKQESKAWKKWYRVVSKYIYED